MFDGTEWFSCEDKPLLKRAKGKVVAIEQSASYKLLDALSKTAERVILVDQHEVRRRSGVPVDLELDDRVAAKIIFEMAAEGFGRDYVPPPEWLILLRKTYRSYADLTKETTRIQLRLGGRDKVTGKWNYPNPMLEAMLRGLETTKNLPDRELGKQCRALGLSKLFDDIQGVGHVASSFWLSTRPWRFPTVGAWLKYSGFRADVGDAYNHEMGGIMHTVAEGLVKAKDPVYYPLYKEIKGRFLAEHAALPAHKCGFASAGTCNKADGKAKNRIKTLLLKEVWRRMNSESEWYKARFNGPK